MGSIINKTPPPLEHLSGRRSFVDAAEGAKELRSGNVEGEDQSPRRHPSLSAAVRACCRGLFAMPRSRETPVLYRFVVFAEPLRQSAEVSRDFDKEDAAIDYAKFLLEQVWGIDVWRQGERIAALS
jgi:hypothetical protein